MRDFYRAVLAFVLVVCVMPASPSAAAGRIAPEYPLLKLSPALAKALDAAAPDEQLPILVRFGAKADLPLALAGAESASRAVRGARVVAVLRAVADAAQAAPRVALAKAESEGRVSRQRCSGFQTLSHCAPRLAPSPSSLPVPMCDRSPSMKRGST